MYEIKAVTSKEDIKAIQGLFLEYAAWLDFPLCFQGFDKELAALPGKYSPPEGRLYTVLSSDGENSGCIGLRKFADGVCEMKRLYVKPAARGKGIGKALVERVIKDAKEIGYSRMRLDTIEEKMGKAVDIYKECGFVEIEAYYDNPNPHTLYMELDLMK